MARKKKSKAASKKKRGPRAVEAVPSDGDAEPTTAATKKKRGRKSKNKKKQSEKAQETEGAVSADSPAVAEVAEVGSGDEVASLVAELAELDRLETEAPRSAAAAEAPSKDEEVEPAVDLDADLDAELDSEGLEALIAQMTAGAGAVESPDETSQDLDDELTIEVLDDEPLEPVAVVATPVPVPAPSARAPSRQAVVAEQKEEPVDRGPLSTPEFRERLLAQALAHTEMQEARYRVPFSDERARGRWKGAMASVILLAAAVLAVVPPGWVQPEPPARLDARDRVGGVRSALLLQAQQVDAFRVRSQRLPNSLDELPDHLPALRYLRSGNGTYQLVGYGPDGQAIIYDSTNPGPEFDRFAPSWLGASP